MSFLLHHDRVIASPSADPPNWLAMLHGAFGSGRNWITVARSFVARRPQWGVLLVDLREHGHSIGSPPPHTLAAAAEDLMRVVVETGLNVPAVLGHSFGGKVALQYVATAPPQLRHAFIIDSTPEASAPSGDAWNMLHLLRRLPASFASRQEAITALRDQGLAPPVAQWIAMNIHVDGHGDDEDQGDQSRYRFRLNLDNIESLLRDFYRSDFWHLIDNPPPHLDLHIVRATRSSIITGAAAARIQHAAEAHAHIHLPQVEGGHWLNVDNPDALVDLLATTLI